MFWGSQNLADPQSLNAYSYANNNPIRFSDPSGNQVAEAFIAGGVAMGLYFSASYIYQNMAGVYFSNKDFKLPTFNFLAGQGQADNGGNPLPDMNNKNVPKWKLVTAGIVAVVGYVGDKILDFKNKINGTKNSGMQIPKPDSNQQSGLMIVAPPTQTISAPQVQQPGVQQNYIQQYNVPTSAYTYSSPQISNLMARISILQQIVYLQTQINQLKQK